MIYKIIKYYEENISDYGLVYNYIPRSYAFTKFTTITYFVTGAFLVTGVAYFILSGHLKFIFFIPFVINLGIFMRAFKRQFKEIKHLLEAKYGIYQEENKRWRTEDYKEKQYLLLVGFLKRNKLYNKEKIQQLIKMIDDDTEKKKLPPILAPGLLIAFIAPLWNHYIPIIFKSASPEGDYKLIGIVFISLICLVIGILFLLGQTQRMYKTLVFEIIEEMFWKESLIRKELIASLKEVVLKI